ncbi:MAG: DNA primase [Treponema sp.]|jgi:DNA primase|nr:DNA primase [Treponema sp.]
MPFISQATKEEVRNRMDALAVVGEYVRLEKRGGTWKGLCPFHNEKTPSFQVNPDLKLYHCFGCGKGGDIFNFIMEMDKISFSEAVETLAKRFGVEIVYENAGASGPGRDGSKEDAAKKLEKEQLFELYRRIAGTFHHLLMESSKGREAKDYILSRAFSEETINTFNLGYAPEDRRWLYTFLEKKAYSPAFLAASGLFSPKFPKIAAFSGRLMFPISDRQGRITAFGGRILPNANPSQGQEQAKYINSRELPIYKKSETLYAIDLAIPEIRRSKAVYIVEGYMDVMAMYQAGLTNTVAPCGTAFTDDQARLLKRWAERVVLVFDSDNAGQTAAAKSILTCRRNGLVCSVVVPEGENSTELKDPADILKIFGPETLKKIVKCCIYDVEFLIARAKKLFDTSYSGGKVQALAFLFEHLGKPDSAVSEDSWIKDAAGAFGIDRDAVFRYLKDGLNGKQGQNVPKEEISRQNHGRAKAPVRLNDELALLMVVAVNDMAGGKALFYPELRKALKIEELENPAAKEIFIALEECFVNEEKSVDYFLARISEWEELKDFFLKRGTSQEFTMNSGILFSDGLKRVVSRKKLEKRRGEIISKLWDIKKVPGSEEGEADELLAEKMEIDAELRNLKEDSL